MSQLHDLLELPEEVTKSAFVIRLAAAVERPDELLRTYAITPDIHHALDQGLEKIGGAVRERGNRATIVHGSFGSGKSHFMAVLSLLAGNDSRAWSEPKLHDLLAKHEWVKTKKVLRLHLNLIGAATLSHRIFDGYIKEVRARHPEAPLPPLFVDTGLFDNAASYRKAMGDEAFFAKLNEGETSGAGWGKFAKARWDAARFDSAVSSSDATERAALLTALVKDLFSAFASQSSTYLPISDGMLAMTRHAHSLGYDGITLFLDELILWLISKAADANVLKTEISNLAALIEGQAADQPIGVAVFAARQRDIAELVGEQYIGQDAQDVSTHMAFWSGRFDLITLPDRNLPAIIEKRVVTPKSPEAAKRLSDAFDKLRRELGPNVWTTLLGEQGDEPAFRKVYPFSPALVDALITLSMCLQRERTALKVLVEMLVGQLEDFEIGKLVPVGDLYDALAEGEDPLDGKMRDQFAKAKRLYLSELLPTIQEKNQTNTKARCQRLRDDPMVVGCANCAETRCRAENRLAKTLLLAALAPQAKTFQNLTASRLLQLNHGTLKAGIPGGDAVIAAQVLRGWSTQIDKVRIGDQDDPTVSILLEGVELRPVLDSAKAYDTHGARRNKLRALLYAALDIQADDNRVEGYKLLWRGTERLGTIQFANVRELDDVSLRAQEGESWKLVIDYPFDTHEYGPKDDQQKIAGYLDRNDSSPTVVWLPSFLSDSLQDHLGELVVIDRLLTGDTLRSYLSDARPDDVARARDGLQSLSRQKSESLRRGLEMAYGLQTAAAGVIDPARRVDQHFYALSDGIKLRNPNAATLKKGMTLALEQLFDDRFPRHPMFGSAKVTRGELDKELVLFTKICESAPPRIQLAKNEHDALRCADALELVRVRDGQALLHAQTFEELDQRLHAANQDRPDVRTLTDLLDPDNVRGLTRELSDYVIRAYAIARGREMVRGGQVVRDPVLGKLDPDTELKQPELPDPTLWHRAVERAATLFGIAVGKARTPRNLRELADRVSDKVADAMKSRAGEIADLLARRGEYFPADAARQKTALSARLLLDGLKGANPVALVGRLAEADIQTSEAALQRHFTSAREVADVLGDEVRFVSFVSLLGAGGEAQALLDRLGKALSLDELQVQLGRELTELSIASQRLLQPAPTKMAAAGPDSGHADIADSAGLDALVETLGAELAKGPLQIRWSRKR